ncbi:MAG: DUF262 and DUF1524 domain-containing protein [Candidatus Falkowbacteria bacterium]
MKANEVQFVSFLSNNQQFVIPIYQRTYSWGISHCHQLWEDILKVIRNDISAHFIGSIVYVSDGLYTVAETPSYLVIDGQQRLTTLSLLFLAMKKVLSTKNDFTVNERQISTQFLINEFAPENKKNKLCLTQSDKVVFEKILNNQRLDEGDTKSKVWQNYDFFLEQINKSNINIDDLYGGIRRLIIVNIILDRNNDNPQLIFESLNSTGLDLSQSDLIRNYILMGLESDLQNQIYNSYWLPMEKIFKQSQNEKKFDYFMRAYLTLKMKAIPKLEEVYATFKQYSYKKDIEEITSDVFKFFEYYSNIELNCEPDKDIKKIFTDIQTLRVDVSHPFLLCVYNDYKDNIINKDEFTQILKLIESYVFRRAVCGVPTSSLNKTFASLYSEITKENYVESLQAVLMLKDSYRRFPKDIEFKNEIINKDIYHFRSSLYLLFKIENKLNHNRTELDIKRLSIEHIMPQELTRIWIDDLGDDFKRVHEQYLHKLGNLTLTGFNQEMSNKSFKEKKRDGFENSGVFMNKELLELDKWDEEKIVKRAEKLSNLITSIWESPKLSDEVVFKYKKVVEKEDIDYSVDDYEHLKGDMLDLFNKLRNEIINLDSSLVREEFKKLYIAYKVNTNFVDIVPQAKRLRLSLNMSFRDINDPRGLCRDVSNVGRWGNGDVEVGLSNINDILYVIGLIRQAFDRQMNSEEV